MSSLAASLPEDDPPETNTTSYAHSDGLGRNLRVSGLHAGSNW